MNILWEGSRGAAVKALQSSLKELGFDPGDIDGIFGPGTTAALTAFQKDRRLFADGVAGPQTLKCLEAAYGLPWSAEARSDQGLRELQPRGRKVAADAPGAHCTA